MKTANFFASWGLISFLCLHSSFGQTPPVLGLQLYAGVNISGTVGSIYAVQVTTNLSNPTGWTCEALVQLPTTNFTWTDTSTAATTGQRFYRAVLTGTNLVNILPGTFTMGSPTNEALRGSDEIQHVVTISTGFYMGKYLVTQGDYFGVTGANPSAHTGNPNYPVDTVSWASATNYCALRTAAEQASGLIPTNWAYRLPKEAEWEYACRAGTVSAFYLGSALRSQQVNFVGTNEYDAAVGNEYNPSGVYLGVTTPVGNYAPNGWGLYDMAGNIFEWCNDWYGPYPTGSVVDPQGPATGTFRVVRGGYYASSGAGCRSALRETGQVIVRTLIGFRVVLAPQ